MALGCLKTCVVECLSGGFIGWWNNPEKSFQEELKYFLKAGVERNLDILWVNCGQNFFQVANRESLRILLQNVICVLEVTVLEFRLCQGDWIVSHP